MKNRKFIFTAGISALLVIAACAAADLQGHNAASKTATPDAAPESTVLPRLESNMNNQLVDANNEFGFELFKQLKQGNKNVFFSPLSVATALAMAYNGAAGETEQAMKQTLNYGEMSPSEINQSTAELLSKLKSSDPKVELLIANSLWARQGVEFNQDFLNRNRQFFGAEVASLDFNSPQAVNRINGWVSQNTKGKIPSIIDQINNDLVLFLINAVYFKGQWQKEFEKKLTREMPFHLAGGSAKQTPLMSQSGNFQYLRGEAFQAISLPYGQGGTSLYLFLPNEESSLDNLLKGLDYQKWQQWITQFRSSPGDIKIPRFKMEYSHELSGSLKALGMGLAFARGKADFSGMRKQGGLFISEVKHKAIIEVNEEGTEAAAATSVGMRTTSMRPVQQRFSFIADRPFLLAIRDQQTGAVLFMGAVYEPN